MALKSNLEYWEYSLRHPEPIFEDYYIKDNLIVENKDLIEKVERLRELIVSYCVVIKKMKKLHRKYWMKYMISLHQLKI
jgi:hypothetical protein